MIREMWLGNEPAKKKTEADLEVLGSVIETVNASRDEKIPFTAEELDMESSPSGCVYVSIDGIGVKHQKDSLSPEAEKSARYIENTVMHIQWTGRVCPDSMRYEECNESKRKIKQRIYKNSQFL